MQPRKDPIIYHGICNPKGENTVKTILYNEKQLKELQHVMPGAPVKILHLDKGYPGAGTVIHSKVHPDTGELHAFFYLNDTKAGKIAQLMTGELPGVNPKKHMGELSLGFSIMFDADGNPIKNKLNELSLCWKGDREGTKILNKIPVSKIAAHLKGGKFPSSRPNSHTKPY